LKKERAAYDPVDLLGRPVHDQEVRTYLQFHDATTPERIMITPELAMGEYYGEYGKNGFSLSADPEHMYRRHYGEPRSQAEKTAESMIVNRIDFSDAGIALKNSKRYPHPLPFGLNFGDSADTISQKLGVKPYSKSPGFGVEKFIWNYLIGDANAIVKLTADLRLCAIYLAPCDLDTRMARERKAALKAENRNICPENIDKVEVLRAAIPTPRWRESMADGIEEFTEGSIAKAEDALNRFIDDVKAATTRKSAAAIYKAVKTVVLALNKLNSGDKQPIETLERDELGVLIDDVVKATGFKLRDGEDITMPWREW